MLHIFEAKISDFRPGVELKKSKIFDYLLWKRWGRRGQNNGFKISLKAGSQILRHDFFK